MRMASIFTGTAAFSCRLTIKKKKIRFLAVVAVVAVVVVGLGCLQADDNLKRQQRIKQEVIILYRKSI